MQLTNDQLDASVAFTNFLADDDEKYFVIGGGPGSGKSTLIKHLLDTLADKYKMINLLKQRKQKTLSIALTATTNKAVAVLKSMQNSEPKTLHSLLQLTVKPNFQTGEQDLIPKNNAADIYGHLIIVDEASFIDFIPPVSDPNKKTLFDYLDMYTKECKIVLVGDKYQLSPMMHDTTILDKLTCPKVELKEIVRNRGIIKTTGEQFKDTVRTGSFKALFSDGIHLHHVSRLDFDRYIDKAFLSQNYTPDYAKVLAWSNNTVVAYNNHIRKTKGYGPQFTAGETAITNNPIQAKNLYYPIESEVKIYRVENNIKLKNISGCYVTLDCGLTSFLPDNYSDVKRLLNKLAKEKNWMEHYEIKDHWFDLRPPYASTVHKAQGSTYKHTFIDLTDIGKCHIASDTARMLYVAITRASENVIVCGNLPTRYGGS